MKRFNFLCTLSLLLSVFISSPVNGQNWPGWRGPAGDGTSAETNVPVKWDSVTNVLWKTALHGAGYSSPVVWNDRLFLTAAFAEAGEKVLQCYNTANGELLWQKTVVKGPFERKHDNNSYASGTPVTDGKMIYLAFLDGRDVLVAAYDFGGRQIWVKRPGTFSSPHGFSCSPVIYEDKVIINGDSQGDAFIAAMNKTDGRIVWKISHDNPAHSFSTPIIREAAGKAQLIFCGNKEIAAYNPDSGAKYWFVNGPSEEFCSSPVYNEKSGLVLVSSSWPARILIAVRPDGNGDVTASHVAWQTNDGAYYVPSPVCTGDFLFTTMTNGKVNCIEIATGKIAWAEDLGLQYPSPVIANGLVYMPNDAGVITVIRPGPKFEVITRNPIGERMNASPAISNGKIYLRGINHLYCIGRGAGK